MVSPLEPAAYLRFGDHLQATTFACTTSAKGAPVENGAIIPLPGRVLGKIEAVTRTAPSGICAVTFTLEDAHRTLGNPVFTFDVSNPRPSLAGR